MFSCTYIRSLNAINIVVLPVLVDIDECETAQHNCSQMCENSNGSYVCFCRTGFLLKNDYYCDGMFFLSDLHFKLYPAHGAPYHNYFISANTLMRL